MRVNYFHIVYLTFYYKIFLLLAEIALLRMDKDVKQIMTMKQFSK